MSALIDALTALGKQLATLNPAANAADFQAIDDHLTKLDTAEGATDATATETKAALQAFLDAASAPVATPAPAPEPLPAPAPTPAP